ncbi:MAG: hypothetical protein A2Z14_14520 [Chloroflexi bacterium RBG_16_48_8]|nr:MAG: hypothetical protein A2Z14_14520 [Chloroflexi bacterium RBG_16_48_8]
MSTILIVIFTGIVMLFGLLGVLLPMIPDLIIIWGAALGYGLLVGWGESGPWLFGAITVFGLIGVVSEIWMSGMGGKLGGASLKSILVGVILGFLGFIFLTPIGGLVLLLVGTFTMEYYRLGNAEAALKGMLGVGLGYGASFGVKLLLGIAMIGLWVLWVIIG